MAKARKETERGRRTRLNILEAATRLMCVHGYSGTSVDMICNEAKVVKTAIYWHFGSKAGLLAALIDDLNDSWVAAIEGQVDTYETPLDRLDKLLESLREIITDRSHLLRLIEVVISEAGHIDAEVVEAVRKLHARTNQAIVGGFNETLGGELESGTMLAHTITSLMHGIHRHVLLYGDKVDLEAFFGDMRRTILASVQERLSR